MRLHTERTYQVLLNTDLGQPTPRHILIKLLDSNKKEKRNMTYKGKKKLDDLLTLIPMLYTRIGVIYLRNTWKRSMS